MASPTEVQRLQDLANQLRILSIQATDASKSGHPTSCASIAEIMSVLFFNVMQYSTKAPKDAAHDRLVLSKGHAAPILYAAWAQAGLFPTKELENLRKLTSDLEGHPTPRLNFVDVATGSLGQGLSVAAGMAYASKYIDQTNYKTYCILGDGEVSEGSVWESVNFASLKSLDNLVAIFDVNRLGQSQEAPLGHDLNTYAARTQSFGWNTIVVDGHSITELLNAFNAAADCRGKPTAIIARTFKGKGLTPEIEDKLNWHGKPLGAKSPEVLAHLNAQLSTPNINSSFKESKVHAPVVDLKNVHLSEPPTYSSTDKIATRFAYGTALVKLGKTNNRVVALDADTKNSTYADAYLKQFPDRFVECYIAEQNLVGVGIGLGCRGRTIPFLSTFAAFFTRAADHLRMAAISQANIKCVGSHCGVSIGEDGPSQMALEDIALFRTIPGATVFYPSDAVSTERACELAAQHHGIDFIRTSRPATPIIYNADTKFEIGKAHVVKRSSNDKVVFIGAGVTLFEALKAAEQLEKEGVHARVIDPFTIKPLDVQTIVDNVAEVGGRVLVVEDHYSEGGIGEAVSKALLTYGQVPPTRFVHLAVNEVPRSGQPNELLSKYGIDSQSIINAVKKMELEQNYLEELFGTIVVAFRFHNCVAVFADSKAFNISTKQMQANPKIFFFKNMFIYGVVGNGIGRHLVEKYEDSINSLSELIAKLKDTKNFKSKETEISFVFASNDKIRFLSNLIECSENERFLMAGCGSHHFEAFNEEFSNRILDDVFLAKLIKSVGKNFRNVYKAEPKCGGDMHLRILYFDGTIFEKDYEIKKN